MFPRDIIGYCPSWHIWDPMGPYMEGHNDSHVPHRSLVVASALYCEGHLNCGLPVVTALLICQSAWEAC